MTVNFPTSAAQNAGNHPVFNALQQCLAGKLALSQSGAIKQSKCSVEPFDHSDATLFKPFLAF